MPQTVKHIKSKTILGTVKQPDTWFGLKYNMNLYRGCSHGCIYCDSRSSCYGIDNFDNEIIIKENALELLKKELASKKEIGTIGFGSMNDCYQEIEKEIELTKKALEIISKYNFPLHILTKSDLVLRDINLLKEIKDNCGYCAVSFTITTTDDNLAKKIEPNASLPSKRLEAIKTLSKNGIYCGITMMPILPFIEDNIENISSIVKSAKESRAQYIIPSFGMTLRDRQKNYYFQKLDALFLGQNLTSKYKQYYAERYNCNCLNYKILEKEFNRLCKENQIDTKIKRFEEKGKQKKII
ncbi:MAG: radical SAM protein [archaeon]